MATALLVAVFALLALLPAGMAVSEARAGFFGWAAALGVIAAAFLLIAALAAVVGVDS